MPQPPDSDEPTNAGDAEDDLEVVETDVEPEADGFRHLRVDIRRARRGSRLDKYLAGRLGKAISRTALQRYIREGNVTVNGAVVKPSYVIRSSDTIDMMLPVVKPRQIPPEPIPLDIIYEDRDILGINKQADLVIHPARGNWTGTLVNGLAYYFQKSWREVEDVKDIKELPTTGEAFRPGIVHRLDRDTTGILLVAKTELALWRLGNQFEYRKIHKTYTALVHGTVRLDEDVIDLPIGRHPRFREKHAVHRATGRPYPVTSKSAVTRYKVLRRFLNVGPAAARFTLVELYPKTGRTHQLRVHMSHLKHPIVGDRMYGGGPLYRSQLMGRHDEAVDPIMTRQALHAHTIEFAHPRDARPMKLEAPLPQDFQYAIEQLRNLSSDV